MPVQAPPDHHQHVLPPAWEHTSVIKKISPHQAGARKLMRRYGSALVCVRHRHDADGLVRYTTVELLVEQALIVRRKPMAPVVCVAIATEDRDLRRRVISGGATWDVQLKAWWMTRTTARRLRLLRAVVAERKFG